MSIMLRVQHGNDDRTIVAIRALEPTLWSLSPSESINLS